MTKFKDRTGDFTKKKYLYKFYKNGYTSRRPKYMTAGQYMGGSGELVDTSWQSIVDPASLGGNVFENSLSIYGSGNSNSGLHGAYRVWTDVRRKIDIDGVTAVFSHSGGVFNFGSLDYYEAQLFDYRIRFQSSNNTLKAFYKTTELASVTMSETHRYIRMRELAGVLYIDRSEDGSTWTNWTSRTIDVATDIVRSVLSLQAEGGAGGLGGFSATLDDVDISDRRNQLLAIETKTLNDFEYNQAINNPASSTTLVFPYSPLSVPNHFDFGNFVEIYTSFFDDGNIRNEPILDHNGEPILDHNSEEIYGVVLHDNIPEERNILKFSGYISSIEYDYDAETISVTFVSHGETMSNSIVRGGQIDVPVIAQTAHNASVATTNSRQTFTLERMTKIDTISLRVQYSGGGSSSVSIGPVGGGAVAVSKTRVWSGSVDGEITYEFPDSVYLQAGQYWVKESYGLNWRYQNTDVLAGGSRQNLSGGNWSNVAGDAFMRINSLQPELALSLSGNSQEIAQEIFEKSLMLDYSPLYLETVENAGYNINVALNVDSAKNAVNALYRQLPSGWFYSVDVGTGAVRIKNRNATPDHLLVFGRDFTEMRVTKDIDEIVNDVYFIGGPIIENGPKLATRTTDVESIAEYRQGLQILSNDKVTRYDTAELLSSHTISNNNTPRLTTEITLSAAKYNTETVKNGDVVKIVNGDRDVLATSLVVADVQYSPTSITISLDSAPRNLSRTIDAIQRDLENKDTAGAAAVL